MSTFIATSIRYNKKLDRYDITGGENNVFPRPSYDSHWDDKDSVMRDILSGSVDISRCRSILADDIRKALVEVRKRHVEKYGDRQENWPHGWNSICPWSLFMIGNVHISDKRERKEEFLANTKNLVGYDTNCHERKLAEYAVFKENWDEFVEFYQGLLDYFHEYLKKENEKTIYI